MKIKNQEVKVSHKMDDGDLDLNPNQIKEFNSFLKSMNSPHVFHYSPSKDDNQRKSFQRGQNQICGKYCKYLKGTD